uniref:Uncharacterized protein n=1 Tax=Proboscia inermis TaxID=420281 RepID=A0A7S0GED4_9STRA
MRRAVPGAIGNGCIHLTDDQSAALAGWSNDGGRVGNGPEGGGMNYACDSSYAYHCARVLLDPSSVAFLRSASVISPSFPDRFEEYSAWLADPAATAGGAPEWSA